VIVWISFFINFLLITSITYFHLNLEQTFSPFLTSFIVFFYLFCIVAPIIQISSFEFVEPLFPNKYPYRTWDVLFTNGLIFLFCATFFISYLLFKKRTNYKVQKTTIKQTVYQAPLVIITLFIICIVLVTLNFNDIIEDITHSIYTKEIESVSSLLIKTKVLFLIPLGAVVYIISYLRKSNRITDNIIICFCILIFIILMLLFFKNPLTEKRNALGPIYITLIYMLFPKLINDNAKFFLFMFLSLVIVFPIMSTFTHIDAGLAEVMNEPSLLIDSFFRFGGVSAAFSSLHYDAFANIMATLNYVSVHGLSLGYQFLGTLLFFIPRAIWPSKPTSTGELVGNHLIDDFGFTYNNLSNSMVSEGYINFGILGVILFAILLSYFINIFIKWMKSDSYSKEIIAFYFAVHLIFFLRGDLTNGFTYFIGPLIAVYFIPKFIEQLFKKSL
jgi:hypothetical protein